MKIEGASRPYRGASARRGKPGIGSCESPQGHTSNVPPAPRPQANSAKRSQLEESFKFEVSSVKAEKAISGSSLYTSHFKLHTRPQAVCAEQSQFCRWCPTMGAGRQAGPASAGRPIAPNKPNPARSTGRVKFFVDKEL